MTTRLPYAELFRLLQDIFLRHGCSTYVASLLATNMCDAERDGAHSHGVFRIKGNLGSLDSGWVDAVASSIRAHWQAEGRGEHLLLSFHGLPQRVVDAGDPYAAQCEASAEAIAARLGLGEGDWTLAYQSRFGAGRWLQPATVDVLDALAARGVRTVDVACPGFAADCLETLEEIAMMLAERFHERGGTLRTIACLNGAPAHADALAALATRELAAWQ